MLETKLLSILDEMAPIEPKLIRERIPKPWYNENINQARKDYRKTCRKWSKSRNKDDWKAYKVLRNAYVKQLNEAKKDFYCSKIQSNKGNTKGLYNTVNGLINREKENPLAEGSDQDLADKFSDFFFSIRL